MRRKLTTMLWLAAIAMGLWIMPMALNGCVVAAGAAAGAGAGYIAGHEAGEDEAEEEIHDHEHDHD